MRAHYDAFITGLVPVKVLSAERTSSGIYATVEVMETTGAYKKGEELRVRGRDVVHTVNTRNCHLRVRSVDLSRFLS